MTTHDHRFVELEGAFNFRDLGGLPTGDGGTTRFGVMFRSDALHHLQPTDVERLMELGMRTVIDLRSSVELERTETLTAIITQLAGVGNLPAVFHCTAGKDRTGMVAALVLSLVGVDDEVIVEDYTLTDERMVLVMERIRAEGDFPEPLAPVAANVARAEASSMETFLGALARTHGGAHGWARAAGLDDDVLDGLHEVLVESPPA